MSCAPGATTRAPEGLPTGPPRRPSPAAEAEQREPTLASAPPPAASDTLDALPSANATELELSIDLPYPTDARPRSKNAVEAAAEDEELGRWNAGGSADPNLPSSQASYHPGTRVVVDTRLAKLRPGARPRPMPPGLSLDRVQAQTRAHGYWPFRLCFEAGQRDKKSSGGETRVAFTIGTQGKVRAARLLDSRLGNQASAACLVREVQKLKFAPRSARALSMVATIGIWPGDAELPELPAGAALATQKTSEFDAHAVRRCVVEKQAELGACFAEARAADPNLWGRLALAVLLEVDGSVHRVSEVESHFPSASATRCAQILLSVIRFPSVNGKPFAFVVPIRLGPSVPPARTSSPVTASPPDVIEDAGVE